MTRRHRLSDPAFDNVDSQQQWSRDITNEVNSLPAFSIFSTAAGPESGVTADKGTLGFEIGSGTTLLYLKGAGSGNTGWITLGYAADPTGLGSAFSAQQFVTLQMD